MDSKLIFGGGGTTYLQPLGLWEQTCSHTSFPTYADLVVRLGVSDALELKLVERLGKLPLGCRQA